MERWIDALRDYKQGNIIRQLGPPQGHRKQTIAGRVTRYQVNLYHKLNSIHDFIQCVHLAGSERTICIGQRDIPCPCDYTYMSLLFFPYATTRGCGKHFFFSNILIRNPGRSRPRLA